MLYDPDEIQVLKHLAMEGAMEDFIPVSSGELGRELGLSQPADASWTFWTRA